MHVYSYLTGRQTHSTHESGYFYRMEISLSTTNTSTWVPGELSSKSELGIYNVDTKQYVTKQTNKQTKTNKQKQKQKKTPQYVTINKQANGIVL